MKHKLFFLSIILPFLGSCQFMAPGDSISKTSFPAKPPLTKVSDIPPPEGYRRMDGEDAGFARWLRNIQLKKDNTVYLYNGKPKGNQQAQFAVLDIPLGKKDLQQCADAIMRLRASWFAGNNNYSDIRFADNNGKIYVCPPAPDSLAFERYLETVFSYCGTLSLERQLNNVGYFNNIQPGDVLIKGGSPGHAVIVMDVAINDKNQKCYMLAQSYMPAQNIHILKNPTDGQQGPWYFISEGKNLIFTPEWSFSKDELKRW